MDESCTDINVSYFHMEPVFKPPFVMVQDTSIGVSKYCESHREI